MKTATEQKIGEGVLTWWRHERVPTLKKAE
jgi:hypothetical protein